MALSNVELITIAISALALIVSGVATINTILSNNRQSKVNESQAEINLRLLEKDDQERESTTQAILDANFIKVGKNHRLKIYNRGKCAARNISVSVPEGDTILTFAERQRKFPLDVLEPQDSIEMHAFVHYGTEARHRIIISWDDESGLGHTVTRVKDIY